MTRKTTFSLLAGLFLATGTINAQSDDVKPASFCRYDTRLTNDSICPAPRTALAEELIVKEEKVQKSKYFVSKHFPFVHKRKIWVIEGCPSF